MLFFSSVTIFTSGLVLLFALSPSHPLSKMLTSIGLALALALGLVVFIVRDMVLPVVALEERSDEMARGELARPVPPAGEADEIGRLSFAFEEMRRALRDKLRSTESLNIDLEREVRRRTEVLEQRNRELHDALEKLRRAQDDSDPLREAGLHGAPGRRDRARDQQSGERRHQHARSARRGAADDGRGSRSPGGGARRRRRPRRCCGW